MDVCAWYVLAVSKAFKTLENEEGYKRCQEIVEEAKSRVDEAVSVYCLVAVDSRFVAVFSNRILAEYPPDVCSYC